jgi:hypothetical protein
MVAMVLWKTATAWTTTAPLTVRFGLVMLAAVLVNPHLIVYDAAILVLPLMWFGAWMVQLRTPNDSPRGSAFTVEKYAALIYALVLAFMAPTAVLIRLQLSVLVMLWLFWKVQRITSETPPMPWSR